jgi:hypothetical protein
MKKMNKAPRKVSIPKKMYVPYLMCSSMSGVTCPTMKLFIQFDEAPRAMPYGRLDNGQISAITIHAHGPQE